jgi:hypothetical protein
MSSLLRPETGDSAKIIARSLFREMKAHGYGLLHMVTLLSELMELMSTEHKRVAGGAAPQSGRGLASREERHPISTPKGAAQPWTNADSSPLDRR